MSARASIVLALLLIAVVYAEAAPVSVPRNALAGRERQQLLDPFPPPRAGEGPLINMQSDKPPARNRAKGKKKARYR
jgi:hypothetical protein